MKIPMVGLARWLWEGWNRVAERAAEAQAQLLLTGFYLPMVSPIALVLKKRASHLALQRAGLLTKPSAPHQFARPTGASAARATRSTGTDWARRHKGLGGRPLGPGLLVHKESLKAMRTGHIGSTECSIASGIGTSGDRFGPS